MKNFKQFLNEEESNESVDNKGFSVDFIEKLNSVYNTLKKILSSNKISSEDYKKYIDIKNNEYKDIKTELDKIIENNKTNDNFKSFTKDWNNISKKYEGDVLKTIYCLRALISEFDKENTEDDSNNNQEEFEGYKEIKSAIDELNKLNKMNDITTKLQDIDKKAETVFKDLMNTIPDDKKAEYEEFKISENDPIIKKLINLKAIMAKTKLKESVVLNQIVNLIMEAEAPNIDEVNKIKEELNNILSKEFTADDVKNHDKIYNNIAARIKKLYDESDEKRKEKLKEFADIPYTLLFALGKSDEELAEEIGDTGDDKAKIDGFINDTKKILDGVQNLENVFNDKFYENLSNAFKKTEDGIETWCGDDEDKLELYTNIDLGDNKNDIIPKVWNAKHFLKLVFNQDKNENYNPFYEYDFLMLLEADEPENNEDQEKNKKEIADKVKNAAENISKLLTIDKADEFKTKYAEWKNGVIELFKPFIEKIEGANNIKDPAQMVSAMGIYLKNHQENNNTEQKPEENGG